MTINIINLHSPKNFKNAGKGGKIENSEDKEDNVIP